MIQDSVEYLKDSEGGVRTVVIGGLLSLFAFLIVPALIVQGYLVRVLEQTERGETEAPTFSEWGQLAIDGLKAVVVGFVYALVPLVLAAVFIGGGTFVASTTNANFVAGTAIVFGSLLTLLAGVAVWYAFPAALARFAETNSVSAAFQFGALKPVLANGDYATGWLLAFVVLLGGGIVVSLLAAIPVLGWIAALLAAFYTQVAAYYIYGRAYGDARRLGPSDGTPTEGRQPAV